MKIFVNLITTIRLIDSLALLFLKGRVSSYIFIANIVLIFLTDSIDGICARKFKVQTMYGSVMDAIADKALCIILIVLSLERIDAFTYILIGEIAISVVNVIFKLKGKNAKSRKFGKIKMWIISITIVLGYLNYFGILKNMLIVKIGTIITLIMQIFTMMDYINYLRQKEAIPKKDRKHIKNINDLMYVLFDTNYYLSTVEE